MFWVYRKTSILSEENSKLLSFIHTCLYVCLFETRSPFCPSWLGTCSVSQKSTCLLLLEYQMELKACTTMPLFFKSSANMKLSFKLQMERRSYNYSHVVVKMKTNFKTLPISFCLGLPLAFCTSVKSFEAGSCCVAQAALKLSKLILNLPSAKEK